MGSLLEVKDLRTHFFTRRGIVKAVDGVSFSITEGETLGLVGESGSGKSITCLSILRLVPQPAGRIVGGQVLLKGQDLLSKSETDMRKIRGRDISMILQDSMTSLNPLFSVGNQLRETIKVKLGSRGISARSKAKDLLRLVGVSSPEVRLRNYPHQLSGGMRQRVVGAIAISCQPALLIADEATTSLDVTIQAQYLRLLRDIQRQINLALLFVTHDFGIVARMCDRVAVMYAGKVIEMASVRDIFDNPSHPYTAALIRAVPRMDIKQKRLPTIEGQPPPLYQLPEGCAFAPRCSYRRDDCSKSPPETKIGNNHWVRCWRSHWDGYDRTP